MLLPHEGGSMYCFKNFFAHALTAFIIIIGSGHTKAAPVVYVFSEVAKVGDGIAGKTITGFHLPSLPVAAPAISSRNVVFYATFSGGGLAGEGLLTPNSLIVKTGDTIGGTSLLGTSLPFAVNDSGQLVFQATISGGAGIFTTTSLLAKTGDSIGGQTLTGVSVPAINSGGAVVFQGSFVGGAGVFTPTSVLAKTGDVIGGQTLTNLLAGPAISDGGTVVYLADFAGGPGIFTQNALLAKHTDTIGGRLLDGPFFSLLSPSISAAGTVTFVYQDAQFGGIFTPSALLVKTGDVIENTAITGFASTPRMDSLGNVVFRATFAGGIGVFTQNAAVAKSGDRILGKVLTSVGPPAVSADGRIAFVGSFTNAPDAVIVAQPALKMGVMVKPGEDPTINTRSRGKIAVAILSDPTFDAPASVNRSSLTFGETGQERSLSFCDSAGRDVNQDGFADLVCHFDTDSTDFKAGDTEAVLNGMFGSMPVHGAASIRAF